jgi:hypothetical protein
MVLRSSGFRTSPVGAVWEATSGRGAKYGLGPGCPLLRQVGVMQTFAELVNLG